MSNFDYENLLARFFSGEASAEERAALASWRKASLENERLFVEYEKLWRKLGEDTQPVVPNVEAAWRELEIKLGLPQAQEQRPARILAMKKPAPRVALESVFAWRGRSGMLAVAAILLLTFSALLYKTWQRTPAMQTLVAANAEQRQVELPDGSLVTLNSGSTLEYPQAFTSAERVIKLSGEAFFEVTHEAERPFLVKTTNAQIKVLGTKFGVWSRAEETRVVVREGRVALREEESNNAGVELTADQMSLRRGKEAAEPARTIDAAYALGWLEGRIVFEQASLAEVAAELQRVYNVEIMLANASLARHTITGSFNRKPIASVLASICLTLNLKYQQEGGKYIVGE